MYCSNCGKATPLAAAKNNDYEHQKRKKEGKIKIV
jgi:hypothetical protein